MQSLGGPRCQGHLPVALCEVQGGNEPSPPEPKVSQLAMVSGQAREVGAWVWLAWARQQREESNAGAPGWPKEEDALTWQALEGTGPSC